VVRLPGRPELRLEPPGQLLGRQRLSVWHPQPPRRSSARPSGRPSSSTHPSTLASPHATPTPARAHSPACLLRSFRICLLLRPLQRLLPCRTRPSTHTIISRARPRTSAPSRAATAPASSHSLVRTATAAPALPPPLRRRLIFRS
jgi:hypothetical protein